MLSGILVSESTPAGRIVFQEGDPGNKFYIVARGRLENYVQWGNDREHVLSVMEDGDWFGELALIEPVPRTWGRSEEHTSELQSLMRISYAVFCLKKKKL